MGQGREHSWGRGGNMQTTTFAIYGVLELQAVDEAFSEKVSQH